LLVEALSSSYRFVLFFGRWAHGEASQLPLGDARIFGEVPVSAIVAHHSGSSLAAQHKCGRYAVRPRTLCIPAPHILCDYSVDEHLPIFYMNYSDFLFGG
jgi:hypothetical protein